MFGFKIKFSRGKKPGFALSIGRDASRYFYGFGYAIVVAFNNELPLMLCGAVGQSGDDYHKSIVASYFGSGWKYGAGWRISRYGK